MSAPMMPFIDLAAQRARIVDKIEAAVGKVIRHGAYVMGPEVFELERQLAAFCGAKHCVSCASEMIFSPPPSIKGCSFMPATYTNPEGRV